MRYTMSIQEEIWKDIPGFNGKYQVSNNGDVRVNYKYKAHSLYEHSRLLNKDGAVVSLSKDGITKKHNVDYLIDTLFGIQHVDSLPNEEWKHIKGFEGYYMISNMGRILSVAKFIDRGNGARQYCKEQIVQAKTIINSGYRIVNLIKNKKTYKFLIHRLVATHFVENPNNLPFVNHKDEDKLNNNANNLEWCTKEYNCNYGTCQARRIATRLRNNNGRY